MMNEIEPSLGSPSAGPSGTQTRIVGAVAAALALSWFWVVSGFWNTVPFPPSALGQIIIRATPGGIATFFIEQWGHWAMRSLTIGVTLGAVLAGGEVLHRFRRHELTDVRVSASTLGVVAAAVSIGSPAPNKNAIAIVLASAGASAVYAYGVVAIRARSTRGPAEVSPDRRRILSLGFGGAAALALSGGVLGWIGRRLAGPDTNVALTGPAAPAAMPSRSPWPEIPGLSPEVTSAADHYVVDINLFKPSIEADGWTLDVVGSVDTPLSLTFDELQARFEIVEDFSVLTCVSNKVGGSLIGNSAWGGVRLMDVLEEAGVKQGAVDAIFRSAEGYSDSIPIEIARDPAVLLAISQNGEPLTQDHGFPCRVRIPPIYGMKNVKWLTEIEVAGEDYQGYWQQRGWSDDATVRTQSRIDVAGSSGTAEVGVETWIAGVAWAGARGVSKVEVSTDGGDTWAEAMLREPIAANAWHQWAFRWTPDAKGSVRVVCRATDGTGATQTEDRSPPHPAGATGYHSVSVDTS